VGLIDAVVLLVTNEAAVKPVCVVILVRFVAFLLEILTNAKVFTGIAATVLHVFLLDTRTAALVTYTLLEVLLHRIDCFTEF
jgi:hypothetical protein